MHGSHDAGKGDTYRPVNRKLYEENYERIFTAPAVSSKNNSASPEVASGPTAEHPGTGQDIQHHPPQTD